MPRAQGRATGFARLTGLRLWQLALAFLAGNLLLNQLPALPQPGWLLAGTLTAFLVIARCGLRPAAIPAVIVLGLCWTALAAHKGLAARWPDALDGRDVRITGWVDSQPRRDAGRTVFTLRVAAAATDVPLRRLRLSWYEPAPAIAAGQSLEIEARLRAPRGLVNPGGFDYERWLFLEGLDATGYVRGGQILEQPPASLAQGWLGLRMALAARLERLLEDPDAAALVTALSLGERGKFVERHWTVLQRTGTSHLVAVSGLHVGLIAAFTFVILLRGALWLPPALARHAHLLAAGGSIASAVLYAALAGFALPTQRALVMLLVAELMLVTRRRVPVGSSLSLALLAVLLFDPLASLSASFWLSFGAVGLLLAMAATSAKTPAGLRSRAAGYLRLQWALTLGLAPLVAWFFGLVSLATYFVNLIAIPVFSLVVVPLSLLLAFCAVIDAGTSVPAWLADSVGRWSWHGLEVAASHPFAALTLPHTPFIELLLAALAVALAVPRHALPGRHLALLGLLPLTVGGRSGLDDGDYRLTALDVGHGLAVVIETRGHRLLFDAGPMYQSGFDAGAEIVAPAVAALGTAPLDLLIVSHADSDHAGGAPSIRARYPAVRVLAGPDVEGAGVTSCVAGQAWTWDQVRFEILHPVAGFVPEGNESSCVLRVDGSHGSLLVTGDIERLAENRLQREAPLAADVVVVPHHGSLTSSSPPFVAAVGARFALVSAGFNNRWGFPRPEVSARWQASGAQLLVTGDQGAIGVTIDRDGVAVDTARARRQRYWRPPQDAVSGAPTQSAL